MTMNLKMDLFDSLFPKLKEPTFQILSFEDLMEPPQSSKPKDDGRTTIDINISLSKGNTHTSIFDSFSATLSPESEKALLQLTQTYAKDVAEVFGKV